MSWSQATATALAILSLIGWIYVVRKTRRKRNRLLPKPQAFCIVRNSREFL
jgi:hypothetical protein